MAGVEIANETIKRLHPVWDAALVVANEKSRKKFLVSSQVLRIASDYFNVLFSDKFQEGIKTRDGLKPDIHLQDDNPDAMDVILSILHYSFNNEWYTMNAESFAVIATHCDKYCCTASLMPWMQRWLANFNRTIELRDIGYLLVSTSMIGESQAFQKISRMAVLRLPLNYDFSSWLEDKTLVNLPEEVSSYVTSRMKEVTQQLYSKLQQTVIDLAANQSDVGRMYSSRCSKCFHVYEKSRSSNCPDCSFGEHEQPGAGDYQVFCCWETRVAECTVILTKHQLYPNEKAWRMGTISEIVRRFNMVRETRTHKCDFDQQCPLRKRLRELEEAVFDVVESIQGQKLSSLVRRACHHKLDDGDDKGEGQCDASKER
ncbi:hypothetical protein LY78DRAFT_676233 [Colletotrichum sublineola]|uniref:BTB domain-containing protein n=1 Tax=Colletotrichum sublineola TaxID=1173701 RepID=A0A066XRV2_COLSU|nr:hypothetical protein LY78DRAFT_676233 [Colletotrichum sublineola]KDN68486.1 hypothetical protein CSUB01_03384 [Colletotrichum sublineola]